MPFKSEKQRRYLWANEPEIARDWTETYGSKIKKAYGGRAGYYSGGQSIPSEYTVEDARKSAMQDKLGGITDIMKKADLYRQGDIGQMYMANGGKISMQGGVKNYLGEQPMVSAPKYWQSAPDHEITELAYITPRERDVLVNMDMYGTMQGSPNEGPSGIMSLNGWGDKDQGFGSPGGGTAGTGGHGYGDQERYTSTDITGPENIHGGTTKTIGPTTPKDHFKQSWSGQPGFLGFGGGYRNLRTPGVTPERGGAYQSRFNPMGLMSLLGGFISRPFSLAVSGINAARNKFGPAFNNFTSSKTLEQFRDKMRGYGRTMPTYSPYLKFGGIETLGQEMPEEINIDEFQPYGVDVENLYEDFPTEEIVATGTNYPGDTNYLGDTETILELEKAKEINDRIKEKQREQEATKGAYYP